jgi:hypothetical protein
MKCDHNYHPQLHLLAIERTGWRRWVFGRWVYSSEPFRRDIQRKLRGFGMPLRAHETLGPEWESSNAQEPHQGQGGEHG